MEKDQHANVLQTFIMTGVGGIISKTIVAPFDFWKTIKQVYDTRVLSNFSTTHSPMISQFFDSYSIRSFKNMNVHARYQVVKRLWTGNSLNLLKSGLSTSIQFNSFEYLKQQQMLPPLKIGSTVNTVVASAACTILSQSIVYPIDQWRIRWMTLLPHSAKNGDGNIFYHAKCIIKQKQVFRGYSASMMSVLPFGTLNFTLQKMYSDYFSRCVYSNARWKEFIPSIAGSLAACTCVTLLFPLDTIKKNVQVNQQKEQVTFLSTTKRLYTTAHAAANARQHRHAFAVLYGLKRFYNGYLPNLAKSFIGYGLRWFIFDTYK